MPIPLPKIRRKYGKSSIVRGISYLEHGTALRRAKLIGGHYAESSNTMKNILKEMVLLKRGMVNGNPFASLPEQSGYIKTALNRAKKLAKPELSPEQQEELNRTILEAYHAQEPVVVSYYQDGYIYQVKGIIVQKWILFIRGLSLNAEMNRGSLPFQILSRLSWINF